MDSGFLYALLDRGNTNYPLARETMAATSATYLIPYVVLTETAFLFKRAGGALAVVNFLDALVRAGFQYEGLLPEDLLRARQIMASYLDSKLDFVDCCIMALSERLDITQVCTLDQCDFSIFRPTHCGYLELLP
jgi:predicted nucleic acid-binding protein